MNIDLVLAKILEQLYNQTQRKHDIHYSEGYGALVVPEGYPLEPQFVTTAISEGHLIMMARMQSF